MPPESAAAAPGGDGAIIAQAARLALVGAPNAGKTSVFNGLTGLRAKTGNYPGVTVSRSVGTFRSGDQRFQIEDLPGSYSLEAISPDEQIVSDVLSGAIASEPAPDAIIAVLDATTLRRSLRFLAELLQLGRPVCLVVTLTDELAYRGGLLDVERLGRALGVPAVRVVGNRGIGLPDLRRRIANWRQWTRPVLPPPADPRELTSWIDSVLDVAGYRAPDAHVWTSRLDRVLLHPVWGTIIFVAVMFGFFQVIFTAATPLQDAIGNLFAWLGGVVDDTVHIRWLNNLLGDALIGGVGNVMVFIPQIVLMFLLISVLEGVGYMSRAAFLMDRIMSKAGLEGRAFVAMLSSLACAVPGIMSTRTLPSARDRIATMMSAPWMTCSARLPVYILLVGMLTPSHSRLGPFDTRGAIIFGLYLLGAVSAMIAAWVFKRIGSRRGPAMPFYMEMPPYRLPTLKSVLLSMWESSKTFLIKCGKIIATTSVVLWLLLNFPIQTPASLAAAHIDTNDAAAVTAYTMNHSAAAAIGRGIEPVFAPLGFDWRIDIGVLGSMSARESFVATLGQVASAENPEEPAKALQNLTYESGPRRGQQVLSPPTIAALLIFFVYALQCMSTIAIMRRETGTWKWPAIAFGYMFVVAWVMAFAAHAIVAAVAGGL